VIPPRDLTNHSGLIVDVVYENQLNTGIALVRDLVEKVDSGEVLATLYDDSGANVAETLVTIGHHSSVFVSDLFPDLEKPFRGYLLIRHGEDYSKVHAIALLIEYRSNGFELTSLPVHPVE
jgi:hypothetical protein